MCFLDIFDLADILGIRRPPRATRLRREVKVINRSFRVLTGLDDQQVLWGSYRSWLITNLTALRCTVDRYLVDYVCWPGARNHHFTITWPRGPALPASLPKHIAQAAHCLKIDTFLDERWFPLGFFVTFYRSVQFKVFGVCPDPCSVRFKLLRLCGIPRVCARFSDKTCIGLVLKAF